MSNFEETAVSELDVSGLSSDELQNIVDNDTRSTARDKAQAELNRRENDTEDQNTEDGETDDAGHVKTSTGEKLQTEGLEAGAGQVQHLVDVANEQGFWDGSNEASPRGDEHTVAGVTRPPEETS